MLFTLSIFATPIPNPAGGKALAAVGGLVAGSLITTAAYAASRPYGCMGCGGMGMGYPGMFYKK